MSRCGVDAEDLTEMIAEIRALDPKPAASFDAEPVHTSYQICSCGRRRAIVG